MGGVSDDLVTWLRAQLDEDERAACAARNGRSGRWQQTGMHNGGAIETDDPGTWDMVVYDEGSPTHEQAEHIARHDPARVLAEVDAKRKRLDWIESELADDETNETVQWLAQLEAVPFAGRPGYREEWRP